MRLKEKITLVTGAAGGLGSSMAEHFGREGASVIVQDLRPDAAEKVAEEVRGAGDRALAWACDVADSAAIEAMFDRVAEEFGDIDVVVANAGVSSVAGDGCPQNFRPFLSASPASRCLAATALRTMSRPRAAYSGLCAASR